MLKNLPIMNMASAAISHSKQRHTLITGNIAHADTPGYQGKDLKAFSIDSIPLSMRSTHPKHIDFGVNQSPFSGLQKSIRQEAFDETLNQNKISIEEEVFKAAEAKSKFNLSTSIFSKSMNLFMSVLDSRR